MHTNEGGLRAYLDGELNERQCTAVAAHLRECAACRKSLEDLAARASATSQTLQALAPRGAELPAPAPVALARLRARLRAQDALRSPKQEISGGWVEMLNRMFSRQYRLVTTLVAMLLVVTALFTISPVRAAASQFLGLFRVRKFAVVSINPAALANLDKAGGQIDKLLSDSVTFDKKPTEPAPVATTAQASQKTGMAVRLPAKADGQPQLLVQDGVKANLKVDLARVRAILDAAGRSDIKLPANLDGATVKFDVPASVEALYNCPAGKPTTEMPSSQMANCIALVQLPSPTIDAPAGVDISQVGEAMLELLGLTPAEAQHFSQAIDWSSTLVIPMPADAGSFQDVTVDGVPGVLIASRGRGAQHYTILWEKNGVVYSLNGSGDPARGLDLANSLK